MSAATRVKPARRLQRLDHHGGLAVKIDIGINQKHRRDIADGLSHFLANRYTLYLRAHHFHWNVASPMFNSLQVMFKLPHTEQWAALDGIAERMRALGFKAPISYARLARRSSITEESDSASMPDSQGMVRLATRRSAAAPARCWTAPQTSATNPAPTC